MFSRPNGAPIATTHSPTLRGLGIADLDDREVGGVDLDDGDVGRLVLAQDLRGELAPVDQPDVHFIRVVDDVRVGQDHAARVDHEARAQALRRSRIRHLRKVEKAPELRRNRVLVDVGCSAHRRLARVVRDPDLDHGRALLRHEAAEVGQGDDGIRCGRGNGGRGGAGMLDRRRAVGDDGAGREGADHRERDCSCA